MGASDVYWSSRRTIDKHSQALSFALMLIALVAVGLGYYFFFGEDLFGPGTGGVGPRFGIDLLLFAVAIISAFIGAYFIYIHIDQERNIQFFEGEDVVLTSTSDNNYADPLSFGDQDIPLEPIKANIYLTNVGILAERKGSGEAAVFIPHDMIREYSPYQNGIRIRYVDENMIFNEVLIIVDHREIWLQTMAGLVIENNG